MQSQRLATIFSVLILAFVGINIVLVFGSFFGFNLKDFAGFTGAATATNCKNAVGGLDCYGVFYPMKPFRESCQQGTIQACTNTCEIEKAMRKDDRVCPTHCVDYCLPQDVAELLHK